jgi:hypothetical protein
MTRRQSTESLVIQTKMETGMADPNHGARFIFVGGAARSGTTLVQNMLDSHPDIYGAPEFLHIPDIISLRKTLRHSIDREWIDLICSYEDVDRHICSLIEGFLYPLAERSGRRFLSEKTPNNILVFPELISLFPGARFIHVVRDPRAIVASQLQVGKRAKQRGWQTQDFTHGVSAAVEYVDRCFKSGFASSEIAPERVIEVVYERLVANPEYETKRICEFLKVEWSSRMLHPGEIKHPGEKAVTNNVWYDTKSYNRNPEPYEVDKWRSQLSRMQEFMIVGHFSANKDLRRLGIDLANSNYSWTDRILCGMLATAAHGSHKVVDEIVALARRSRKKVSEGYRVLSRIGDSK